MCPPSTVYIINITGGKCGHVDIPETETALLVLCLLIKSLLSKVLQTGWLYGHRGCAIFFYGFKIHSSLYTYCNLHRYKNHMVTWVNFIYKPNCLYFPSPQRTTVHPLFWNTCFFFSIYLSKSWLYQGLFLAYFDLK